MAVTWANVEVLDPGLSAVPEPVQTAILAFVAPQVNSATWGKFYDHAITLLAAHLGTLRLRAAAAAGGTSGGAGGIAGPVTSMSADGVAASFGLAAGGGEGVDGGVSAAALQATQWGKEYRRLLYTLPRARSPFVI